jgi:superfamily II DNA or RNA helicase
MGLDPGELDDGLRRIMRDGVERLGRASPATASNVLELRGDQVDVARDLASFLARANASRSAAFGRIVLPPRTGKTVIAAHLLERSGLHGLFLVPTRTLVQQTVREMRARAPSVAVGAFFGEEKELVAQGVNVATYALVQRAWQRGELPLAIRTAAVVFADEGHRAMTPARMDVLQNAFLPSSVRIALTATPDYDEVRTLCRFFPELVHEMALEEAMDLGLLAPLRVWVAEVDADASKVRVVAGDYDESELGEVMSAAPFFAATRAFRYGSDNAKRPALIVCTTRQQAKDLRSYLELHRPEGAAAPALVLGETQRNEREQILDDFRRGEINTIVQVGVLIEGWNAPECKLLIDLAPSLSRVRATQKFFRVMTKHESAEARIFVVLPSGLPFVPILPMELFGRSIDEYEQGERIGREAEGETGLRPLVERSFDGIKGVRLAKRILLHEKLKKPALDPRKRAQVRRVLESCDGFDPLYPPSVSHFQSLFFDHSLFLGRGSSLLRWLRVAPTRRAYAAFMARIYPETSAALLLLEAGGLPSDWPTRADARHLRCAMTGAVPVAQNSAQGIEHGWIALTGGGHEPPMTPEEILLVRERGQHLRDLVAELPARVRFVLETMFDLSEEAPEGGVTITELADILDVSRSRAKQIVRVARARLAKRVAAVARSEGEAPATFWGQRPSAARGILLAMVPFGVGGFRYFAALSGAKEPRVEALVAARTAASERGKATSEKVSAQLAHTRSDLQDEYSLLVNWSDAKRLKIV